MSQRLNCILESGAIQCFCDKWKELRIQHLFKFIVGNRIGKALFRDTKTTMFTSYALFYGYLGNHSPHHLVVQCVTKGTFNHQGVFTTGVKRVFFLELFMILEKLPPYIKQK